jgi:hypothetical protein
LRSHSPRHPNSRPARGGAHGPAGRGNARWGVLGPYRPVLGSVARTYKATYPRPAKLFQISQIGGWDSVNKELFDNNNGLAVKAQQ